MKTTGRFASILLIGSCALTRGYHATGAQTSTQSWITHRDPAGFEVTTPRGWFTEGARDGHVLIRSADSTEFAVAQPFKSPNGGSASEWMSPLVKHMSKLFPDGSVVKSQTVSSSPDVAIAKISYSSNGKEGQANALCFISNGEGMFFAIAAPSGSFAASKTELMKVLQSFRYTVAATAEARGAEQHGPVTYTTWKEPNEDAFTTEVPAGWKVTGGVYRYAPIDVRIQVDAGPAGSSTHIQLGDAKIATYATPGPSSQVRGLSEGQSYEVNGVPYTVFRYVPGAQYSRVYVQSKLAKLHPGLELGETRDLPDETAKLNQKSTQSRANVGETEFSYPLNGDTIHGVCIANTEMIGSGLGAIWTASPSTATASGSSAQVREILKHIVERTVLNPKWVAQNAQINKEFSQMVLQRHEQAMAQIHAVYEKFTHNLAENSRQWSNIINGEVDVRNAATGQTFKASAGSNYYYQSGGSVVGSSASRAGINLTPLQQY